MLRLALVSLIASAIAWLAECHQAAAVSLELALGVLTMAVLLFVSATLSLVLSGRIKSATLTSL